MTIHWEISYSNAYIMQYTHTHIYMYLYIYLLFSLSLVSQMLSMVYIRVNILYATWTLKLEHEQNERRSENMSLDGNIWTTNQIHWTILSLYGHTSPMGEVMARGPEETTHKVNCCWPGSGTWFGCGDSITQAVRHLSKVLKYILDMWSGSVDIDVCWGSNRPVIYSAFSHLHP